MNGWPRALYAVPNPRVLVADDHGPLRSLIAEALRAEGFAVSEAEDGAAALRQLRDRTFRVAVVDVRMPVLDGLELLERMTADGLDCDVILMSVVADAVSRRRAEELGAMAFHQKPFLMQALLDDVRRACAMPAPAGTALS